VRRRERPVAAGGVPTVLVDPDAVVWHDQDAYRAYMAAHGWSLPASERFGCPASARLRRRRALAGWAVEAGVSRGTLPDWSALKARGLL